MRKRVLSERGACLKENMYTKKFQPHIFPLLILFRPRACHSRQVRTHSLPLHLEKVLPNSTDLAVYLCGVGRVAVLEREAVGVVDKLVTVGDVVLEETVVGQ